MRRNVCGPESLQTFEILARGMHGSLLKLKNLMIMRPASLDSLLMDGFRPPACHLLFDESRQFRLGFVERSALVVLSLHVWRLATSWI